MTSRRVVWLSPSGKTRLTRRQAQPGRCDVCRRSVLDVPSHIQFYASTEELDRLHREGA